MRTQVIAVASDLFATQGFAQTTVDEIAAAAGVSRATFFRYFATKEDAALGDLHELGRRTATAFAEQPRTEAPWRALIAAFETISTHRASETDRARQLFELACTTPSIKARHWEKQQQWTMLLVPEMRRRLGDEDDLVAQAMVGSGLACLDVATEAWRVDNGARDLKYFLQRCMNAMSWHPLRR